MRWFLRAAPALLLVLLSVSACAPVPPGPTPTSGSPTPNGETARPATTTSAMEPEGGWPGPDNTGVPDGTRLSPYTGDCVVTTPGAVIDAAEVDCDLSVRAVGVVITRSRINGSVNVRNPEDGFSFTITDSEVHIGDRLATGLGNGNFTATRVEVTGGRRSAYCQTDCTIERSWLHAQSGDPGGEAHLSAVRMGQNTSILINTIVCEADRIPPASGCSAALTGYGDFAPVVNNLIEGNLFQSGTASFCAFGGSTKDKPFSGDAANIRFIGNVFQRNEDGTCGIHGPIVAFDPEAPGNVWEGNVWDDGEPVPWRN